MHGAETQFLVGLEGTEVHTDAKTYLQLPSQTWVITEKLDETSLVMTQKDMDHGGLDPPFAAAKFLCHRKDDPTKKPAFLRIYHQIPIAGTEFSNSRIRANQAVPPIDHPELDTLKMLKEKNCKVVPDLLGYQEGQQGDDGIVPSGFSTCVVWDKVPGEPLTQEYFWNKKPLTRKAIREEFRRVYQ